MAKAKKSVKVPERRCVGCGNSFPKKELIRVVKDSGGNVSLDFTGKKAGRGAYVCQNADCFAKAVKAKRFETNLDCAIPGEIYESLAAQLNDHGKE